LRPAGGAAAGQGDQPLLGLGQDRPPAQPLELQTDVVDVAGSDLQVHWSDVEFTTPQVTSTDRADARAEAAPAAGNSIDTTRGISTVLPRKRSPERGGPWRDTIVEGGSAPGRVAPFGLLETLPAEGPA
jgi:hypothetical protein